jgi:hypothetical protein
MCMYSVSPRQQGDPEGECCDMRQLLLRNEAATSEIIPAHLYEDQADWKSTWTSCCIYIASLYPSETNTFKLPFALQQ